MKALRILFLPILAILIVSCHEKSEHQMMDHSMHHGGVSQVTMDADIPIFEPSERTFVNRVVIQDAENLYIRHDTGLENRQAVRDFYQKELQAHGWELNAQRSDPDKFAVHKDQRFATIRLFEIKEKKGSKLGISVNLVKPLQSTAHTHHEHPLSLR